MNNKVISSSQLDQLTPENIDLASSVIGQFADQVVDQLVAHEKNVEKQINTFELQRNRGKFLPVVQGAPAPPDNTFIVCPATNPTRRRVKKCTGCEHFDGVFQRAWAEDGQALPWQVQYGVRCKYPMERIAEQLEFED